MSTDEFRELVRETVMAAARFVPRSRRAEFLEGLPTVLERAFEELAAGRRRSQLHAIDDPPARER